MIDKIISFGDSFMYGSDLPDCDGTAQSQFSQLTWPALCAKELGLAYHSYAIGSVGNYYIATSIMGHASNSTLCIINWSWIDRFTLFTTATRPLNITPTSKNETSKFYYKHLNSEINDRLTSLFVIHSTHQYLKNNNIPFIATYMDKLILDEKYHNSPPITSLQNSLKDDLITFPNDQTFLEWSRSNGYPESKGWHPLEQAHQEASKIWLPIYKEAINTHITNSED